MKGYVHSFESLAAVDGDGLRYGVFLAGCPLRCVYCHNPDTWTVGAGQSFEASELVKKIARYRSYFGERGGVTFSGGEPLLQAEWLCEVAELLRNEGIGYVLDTSGGVPLTEAVRTLLAGAQGILLDLKFPDEESYRRYTGRGISETLAMLDYLESIGKETRIRIVVVPGINDSEDALERYLVHLRGKNCVSEVELLGFHTMGFHKYEALGIENRLSGTAALDPAKKDRLQAFVNAQLNK
ncbi:MAG: radical SAM protein [Clostridia bacterium]|nr:radical SAM protein [Clostridia bacterium]